MKRKILTGSLILFSLFSLETEAGEFPLLGGKRSKKKKPTLLREIPTSHYSETETLQDSVAPEPEFKPSIQVGSIVHMFASYAQVGYPGSTPSTEGKPEDWTKGFSLYRGRILVGGQLSKKGSFFLETELPAPVGSYGGAAGKNPQAPIVMLDCQYEHKFAEAFQVIAGSQLVSGNRNGLQGAASLLANDFTFYQYAYNTFPNQPLRSNFGRDVGINFRGLLFNSKLEYRLGVFVGRGLNGNDPLRTVGRLVYNFLDADRNFYYSGTNLGKGKTISLGFGVDGQANYLNIGPDLFIDLPVGPGSITLNTAFQFVTGGTDTVSRFSYSRQIPSSTIQFGELGYYIPSLKIQPWIRYENFMAAADQSQTSGVPVSMFDKLNKSMVFGGGLNYFFNGYGTNLRLSYVTKTSATMDASGEVKDKAYGQAWLQLQFFLF